MSENQAVLFEKKGPVGIITINNPPVNSLSHDVFEGFRAQLDANIGDKELRAMIITGSGDRAFCAGADLSSGFGVYSAADFLQRGQDIWNKIEEYPKPIIAAVNGNALGGGCELAMACHVRFFHSGLNAKGKKSVIGLSETGLGIMPGYGGTMRMPRLIGRSKALRYILTAERLEPEQALEDGLVDFLSSDAAACQSDAIAFAKMLATRPPLAVREVLKIFARMGSMTQEQHLKMERESLAGLFSTKDTMEGMTAFAQKREPKFTGE